MNIPMTTCEDGRKLMIQFTCGRCKVTSFCSYDEMMDGETYGYLRNSKLPKGWGKISYSIIACPTCVKEFEKFMHPDRIEEK